MENAPEAATDWLLSPTLLHLPPRPLADLVAISVASKSSKADDVIYGLSRLVNVALESVDRRNVPKVLNALLDGAGRGLQLRATHEFERIGPSLSAFAGAFRNTPNRDKSDQKARASYIDGLATLLNITLRSGPKSALIEGLFSCVRPMATLTTGHTLADVDSEPIHILAGNAFACLEMRALMGVADIDTHFAFVETTGASVASVKARDLARNPALPPSIRAWLTGETSTEKFSESRAASDASVLRAVDERIAELIQNLMTEEEESGEISAKIRQNIEALAVARRLRAFGQKGELSEFNAARHRLLSSHPTGKKIRLLTPGIESLSGNQSTIILPAIVEEVI